MADNGRTSSWLINDARRKFFVARAGRVLTAMTLATVGLTAPARAAVQQTCQGEPATIVGTTGDDQLVGTSGDDVIAAREGNDVVHGRGGDDLICGGDGDDRIVGGVGADRMFGGAEADTDVLVGGPGDDVMDCGDTGAGDHDGLLSYHRAKAGVDADLLAGRVVGASTGSDTVSGCQDFHGTRYPDTIDATGYSIVNGSGGADMIVGASYMILGRRGDDMITATAFLTFAGPGDDTITLAALDPIVDGQQGADHLIGTDGQNGQMFGGDGADWLEGMGGDDWLHGGPGDDLIEGGDGRDHGFGDEGTDRCDTERRRECERSGH